MSDGDSTRRGPGDDGTRPKPAGAGDDGTRLKPAGPGDDGTRLKPAGPGDDGSRTDPPTGDTGSNWSHPEQWQRRSDAPLGPGSVIKGRFLLDSVLGEGGMGVVYRALDRRKEEAQDRDPHVAVKVLSEEFRRHPNALMALQREARKAQTLAHPNVVTVHDFDRDGTTVYMTMELLDGEALKEVIGANELDGLPVEEALSIVRGMAAALAYAHQKGIVHSDLKPGNVFLMRDGGVKVLDFGIARAVPTRLRPNADKTLFDATELGALTPSYASPQMLRGEAPVPADDVFAVGIVAYELLTGRHPFDRRPADDAERRGLVPAPVAGLPRRQRKALGRALSFDRASRYENAAAFLAAIEGPSPLKAGVYAATLVCLAAAAAYGLYTGNQIRPDVEFSSLPPEVQTRFEAAVAAGEEALGFGAIGLNDAFDYYSRAYDIHRNNPRAVRGLENVADGFLDSMGSADAATRRNVFRKLYCQEYLSGYDPLVTACADTVGTPQCTSAAMGCPVAE